MFTIITFSLSLAKLWVFYYYYVLSAAYGFSLSMNFVLLKLFTVHSKIAAFLPRLRSTIIFHLVRCLRFFPITLGVVCAQLAPK